MRYGHATDSPRLRRPLRTTEQLLWGHLHGAERLIGRLLPADEFDDERADRCRQAFAAIAEEEASVLPEAPSVPADVRAVRRRTSAGKRKSVSPNVSPTEQF